MGKTDREELDDLAGSARHDKWPALQSTAFILFTSMVIWLAFVMAVANLG